MSTPLEAVVRNLSNTLDEVTALRLLELAESNIASRLAPSRIVMLIIVSTPKPIGFTAKMD